VFCVLFNETHDTLTRFLFTIEGALQNEEEGCLR